MKTKAFFLLAAAVLLTSTASPVLHINEIGISARRINSVNMNDRRNKGRSSEKNIKTKKVKFFPNKKGFGF